MSKQKVKAKGTVAMEEVISFLEEILNGMRNGQVFFDHEGGRIRLTPGGFAEVEIEAEQKDGKQALSFDVKWKERIESDRKLDLKISSEAGSRTMSGGESEVSSFTDEGADVHPEEELRRYTGTEAFGSGFEDFSPRA
jgi:amphi-Trp domain-containing protein